MSEPEENLAAVRLGDELRQLRIDAGYPSIQALADTGYFPGLRGPYELASGAAIPDTLLMLAVEDQMVQDGALTRKAVALFEAIRSYALNAEDSRALIVEAIAQWKNRQQ